MTDDLDLFDLAPSAAARPVIDAVREFVAETVEPRTAEYYALGAQRADPGGFAPGQLELLADLQRRACSLGLWNLFIPDGEEGAGLSNLDYAYVAAELGRNPLASEATNCSPPDTGNMEALRLVGTPEQRARWLDPLLAGEVRSAFAMTEPTVASSDPRNLTTSAVRDGDEWVIDGEKFFVTGADDPRCAFVLTTVVTHPDARPDQRQTIFVVPRDAPGLSGVERMQVFGHDESPGGHLRLRFDGVRLTDSHVLLGHGRGGELSQLRLGTGRIHGCMRSIGAAERALALMVERAVVRTAFGRSLGELGGNQERISRARIDIDAMRLMVLKAARAIDVLGHREARIHVSAAKAMVPERVCRIIDEAIQLHGAAGLSQWTPLAEMYQAQRAFRLGDGPDEVHHMVVGRAELAQARVRGETA